MERENRIGQLCGNYRLVKLLGRGGFADVYLGENIHLKTQAAIKVLQTRLTAKDMEDFRSEARTIASLDHPNIIRLLDFGVRPEDNTPYLVMNYAPNGSLRDHIPKNTPMPLSAVLPYIEQVARALQYAHSQRVIHRDVKPENMLLGKSGEALLTDFGISVVGANTARQEVAGNASVVATEPVQAKADVAGTAPYMAPEQIQGHPDVASDQYALGIVVYEWLTGDRPFHGNFIELCSQHIMTPPPPLRSKVPGIPPIIDQIVLTALAKEPSHRFRSIESFVNALKTVSHTRSPSGGMLYHPVCLRCGTLLPVGGQFCSNCGFQNTGADSLLMQRGASSTGPAVARYNPTAPMGMSSLTPIEQMPTSRALTTPSLPGSGNYLLTTTGVAVTTPRPRAKVLPLLLVLALLLAVVAGYFYLTTPSKPTQCTSATCATTTPGSSVLFSDDFVDNGHQWDLNSPDPATYTVSIANHALVLDVNANQLLPEVIPGPALSNFTLTVDATLSSAKGSQENGYGVYIRATSRQGLLVAYYRFELYGDGTYAVYKGAAQSANDDTTLVARAQQASPAIHAWGQLNQISIQANGPNMTLLVNGQQLGAVINDGSYSSGVAALFVANPTNTAQGAQASFAHLRITNAH